MKEYKFKINGKDYAVKIGEASGRSLTVNVNGADYEVELENELAAAGDTSAGAEGPFVISTGAEGSAEKSPSDNST